VEKSSNTLLINPLKYYSQENGRTDRNSAAVRRFAFYCTEMHLRILYIIRISIRNAILKQVFLYLATRISAITIPCVGMTTPRYVQGPVLVE
jgi:hypothetical protein